MKAEGVRFLVFIRRDCSLGGGRGVSFLVSMASSQYLGTLNLLKSYKPVG